MIQANQEQPIWLHKSNLSIYLILRFKLLLPQQTASNMECELSGFSLTGQLNKKEITL